MYKILKLNNILSICGAVYRVDYDVIYSCDNEPGDEIISWFKSTDYPDDNYLICKYNDSTGEYEKTVGVVFYNIDETECESFVDCAEHDFRVYGDVAHNPVPSRYLYKELSDAIKNLDILDKVVDLVNDEFYDKYL